MVSISKITHNKTVSKVVSKTEKVKKGFSINPQSKKSKTLMLTLTALAALNCANVGITRAAQARYDHIVERKAKGLEIDECEEFNLSLQTTKPRVNQSHVGITEDLKVFSEKEINEIGIDKWIEENRDKLVGGTIFVRNRFCPVSRLIALGSKANCTDYNEFMPTHTVPIYESDGEMKIINIADNGGQGIVEMSLKEYLEEKQKPFYADYQVFLRNFDIDEKAYSEDVAGYISRPYDFLAAGQSVLKTYEYDGGDFCSKDTLELLQKQGILTEFNANKCTPHDLYHLLKGGDMSNSKLKYVESERR